MCHLLSSSWSFASSEFFQCTVFCEIHFRSLCLETLQFSGGCRGRKMKAPASSEQALAMEEQFLKRKQMNTYKERRKEGRTTHSASSRTAIVCGGIGLIANVMAIIMPSWRASYIGLLGYGHRRYWGLWQVEGQKRQFHWNIQKDTCEWWTRLMLGNTCLSPICKWYQHKCFVYWDLMAYSVGVGTICIIAVIIQMFCVYWTIKFDTRSIAWAANWWCVACFLHTTAILAYQIIVQFIFEELDRLSWYPLPFPGAGWFLALLGAIMLVVNTVLGFTLRRMWPEVDPDDSDQFASDDDDSDSDEAPKKVKKPQAKAKAASGAAASGAASAAAAAAPKAAAGKSSDGRQWFYKDKSDKEQGPFPTSQVLEWHSKGAFPPETMFRSANEKDFAPLGDGSRLKA
eukprot:gb/GFBE01009891.1/.p1 GENE.gb/GFBE01009891.1/~~gb/GFBE01009891.1/.p1  ORF type:complete len:400 (+),score=68.43 gb/GFBE01009891.1/:1-1200(+)